MLYGQVPESYGQWYWFAVAAGRNILFPAPIAECHDPRAQIH